MRVQIGQDARTFTVWRIITTAPNAADGLTIMLLANTERFEMKYHIVTFLIGATAAIGAMLLAGPYDTGPWPLCQYEDGNPDGNECIWINREGNAYYNTSEEYRN